MALGIASLVTDADEKAAALNAFVDRVVPGRSKETRAPTGLELKATSVLRMDLSEVSAKIRTGPPKDEDADYELPYWAGIVPISVALGSPEADPRLTGDIPVPATLGSIRRELMLYRRSPGCCSLEQTRTNCFRLASLKAMPPQSNRL